MYPLLLKPLFKNYIWGGTQLKEKFGFKSDDIMAEAWMLTCRNDAANIVMNGQYKGKSIMEVLEIWGKDALGKNANRFDRFPILIKFIDARESLSVQVHPNDKYALENEGEFGKSEMWYIIDAQKGAQLLCGLKGKTEKELFAEKIKENDLYSVCNFIDVQKGDCVFIPAGTIHAIGAGILIAEVQQNSDVTYRVSDYGRLGGDGNPRELHLEKAIEVLDFNANAPKLKKADGLMHSNDKFSAELVKLNGQMQILNNESFVSLVFISGECEIAYKDGSIKVKEGDSLFIPAHFEVVVSGKTEILKSYV